MTVDASMHDTLWKFFGTHFLCDGSFESSFNGQGRKGAGKNRPLVFTSITGFSKVDTLHSLVTCCSSETNLLWCSSSVTRDIEISANTVPFDTSIKWLFQVLPWGGAGWEKEKSFMSKFCKEDCHGIQNVFLPPSTFPSARNDWVALHSSLHRCKWWAQYKSTMRIRP